MVDLRLTKPSTLKRCFRTDDARNITLSGDVNGRTCEVNFQFRLVISGAGRPHSVSVFIHVCAEHEEGTGRGQPGGGVEFHQRPRYSKYPKTTLPMNSVATVSLSYRGSKQLGLKNKQTNPAPFRHNRTQK